MRVGALLAGGYLLAAQLSSDLTLRFNATFLSPAHSLSPSFPSVPQHPPHTYLRPLRPLA